MATKKKRKKPPVMRFRQSLFWDTDPKTIDPARHARYIIERVLDFGNRKEVLWLFEYYPPRMIRDTLKKSRIIDVKSRALWSLLHI